MKTPNVAEWWGWKIIPCEIKIALQEYLIRGKVEVHPSGCLGAVFFVVCWEF